jgi:hypothetical protein
MSVGSAISDLPDGTPRLVYAAFENACAGGFYEPAFNLLVSLERYLLAPSCPMHRALALDLLINAHRRLLYQRSRANEAAGTAELNALHVVPTWNLPVRSPQA